MKSTSTCSGLLEIRRSSCVSVSIFFGMRFRITSLSGRTRWRSGFGLFKREDALGVENVSGRKAAGNLDRHVSYYGADPDMAYSAVFIDGPQRYTKNG